MVATYRELRNGPSVKQQIAYKTALIIEKKVELWFPAAQTLLPRFM